VASDAGRIVLHIVACGGRCCGGRPPPPFRWCLAAVAQATATAAALCIGKVVVL